MKQVQFIDELGSPISYVEGYSGVKKINVMSNEHTVVGFTILFDDGDEIDYYTNTFKIYKKNNTNA